MGKKKKTQLHIVLKKLTLNTKTYTDQKLKRKWRKLYYVDTNEKKTGVFVLISGKAYFTVRKMARSKKSQCIMTEAPNFQEHITMFIVYLPNNRVKIH